MYPPLYSSLMRLVIDLRRWYVANHHELTVEEDNEFRRLTEGMAKLADDVKRRWHR